MGLFIGASLSAIASNESSVGAAESSHDEIYSRFEQVENLTPIKPIESGSKKTHEAAAIGNSKSKPASQPLPEQERAPASEAPLDKAKEDKI